MTAAACARTRSCSSLSRSAAGSPASWRRSPSVAAESGPAVPFGPDDPAARRRAGISRCHSGGSSAPRAAWARSPATSMRAGTSSVSSLAMASSSSARPSPAVSGVIPPRAIRARSALAQGTGDGADPGPQAPGQRHRGQARGPAAGGQAVEERVGRRVVALPGAAEGGRGRGEQDEHLQVRVAGQLVQVPGGVGLGPHHRLDPGRGQRPDHAVVDDPGRVHHAGQRVTGRDAGQQASQRAAVRGVARHHPHPRARGGQASGQGGGPGRSRSGTTQQNELPGPPRRGQVPRDQGAQHPGAPGDQHRPGRPGRRLAWRPRRRLAR